MVSAALKEIVGGGARSKVGNLPQMENLLLAMPTKDVLFRH